MQRLITNFDSSNGFPDNRKKIEDENNGSIIITIPAKIIQFFKPLMWWKNRYFDLKMSNIMKIFVYFSPPTY